MKDQKKKKIIIGVSILLILFVIFGISYAWLSGTFYGKKKVTIASGNLELLIDNENEGITLDGDNAIPMYDEDGVKVDAYTFTLNNTGNADVNYEIYLDNDDTQGETTLEDKDIKYQIKSSFGEVVGSLSDSRLIEARNLKKSDTISYELRVWLSIDAENDAMGKAFYGKIRVVAVQDENEKDETNANAPKLASNMIPVVYSGKNWVKAGDSNWYNYSTQKWANAVTVSNDTRDKYKTAKEGTIVSMDDIDTMWVWIPRYSYTIRGDGNNYYGKKGAYLDHEPTQALPGEIDVKFVSKETTDRGTARYTGTKEPTGWYTPDAFTFDEKELEGVWVGKFETSNKEGNFRSDSDLLTPIIKPKVTSWRDIKISTLEKVSMKMNKENNIYGFVESETDTHTMKGSEWALVAYLSQSKYGKLGNRSYTEENKQVYMNAYSGYRTGCSYGEPTFPNSSGEPTCSHEYDEIEDRKDGTGAAGAGASTTGNIYGIYDMNGGAWEYVMSNYNGYTGNTEELNSGYNGLLTDGSSYEKGIPYPNQKYYDKYLNASTNLISHAMGETAGFYGDIATMVSITDPWQIRGGGWFDTLYAGVFGFHHTGAGGGVNNVVSFRLALTNK